MNSLANSDKPWLASYPPDVDWDFQPVERRVYDIFEKPALAHPDKPCIDFLDKKYSYGEIHDLVKRFACGLEKAGIGKGERVGLCLPNCPYYVIAFFAVQKIGAVVVNFNVLYTTEEMETQILDSEVKIMVTIDLKAVYNKVAATLANTMLEKIIICPFADALPATKKYLLKYLTFFRMSHAHDDDNNISYETLLNAGADSETAVIDPFEDIALFQYTGGTTGIPKAAMLTHSNVASNTEQVTLWTVASQKLTDNDRFLAVLPFFHVFSMTVMMGMGLRRGAELVLLPRFKLKQALQAIKTKKITVMAGVPAIFHAINEYPKLDHYPLSSLAVCISGGAALPPKVREKFIANTSCRMVEGYGLSETSPVITCNPPHNEGKAGSVGLPFPGTEVAIRSMEAEGKLVPMDEKGELIVRGPQVMKGYWNRPEDSADVLSEEGWLRTGDIAYMDKDGFVFLTDRLKDVIITNGYKIYPRVIEDALYQHGAVSEAIVIGIPDTARGEVAKAYVVLKAGEKVTTEKLLDFIADKLNPIECPKTIELRDELPKTLIGKPSRKDLAAEEAATRSNQA